MDIPSKNCSIFLKSREMYRPVHLIIIQFINPLRLLPAKGICGLFIQKSAQRPNFEVEGVYCTKHLELCPEIPLASHVSSRRPSSDKNLKLKQVLILLKNSSNFQTKVMKFTLLLIIVLNSNTKNSLWNQSLYLIIYF